MLSINKKILKNKNSFYLKLILLIVSFSLVSCASAPYQEMSNARQLISLVTEEIEQTGLQKNQSINDLLEKAKAQLKEAKTMLNNDDYKKARDLAIKASKLAQLAKVEVNKQK